MKKSVCLILSVLFILLAFTSCASQGDKKTGYLNDANLALTTPKAQVVEKMGLVHEETDGDTGRYAYPDGKYTKINNLSFLASFWYVDEGFLDSGFYAPVDENPPADTKDKMKKYFDSIYGESQAYADEYGDTGVCWTTEVEGEKFEIGLLDGYEPSFIIFVEHMDDESASS